MGGTRVRKRSRARTDRGGQSTGVAGHGPQEGTAHPAGTVHIA